MLLKWISSYIHHARPQLLHMSRHVLNIDPSTWSALNSQEVYSAPTYHLGPFTTHRMSGHLRHEAALTALAFLATLATLSQFLAEPLLTLPLPVLTPSPYDPSLRGPPRFPGPWVSTQ